MSRTALLAGVVLLALVRAAPAQNEPEIVVEITNARGRPVEQIYEGQSVEYSVLLNYVENPSPPQLSGFDDFDVASLGAPWVDVDQIDGIRGIEIHWHGRQYRYRLTPRKTGLLRVPAPTATVDGKVLKGPERTLQVLPAEEQDVAFLEITADRQSVYPMQPFSITLSVAVRGLPEPHGDRSPVSVQSQLRYRPPALRIPWIDDDLPDGLESEESLSRWAQPLLDQRGAGFSINGLGTRSSSLFSFFDDQPLATFLPKARKVVRPDKDGSDATYWQYDFVRTFTARQIGRYTFGPVTLEGAFVTAADEDGRVSVDEIYAVAKPVEVIVKDVPQEGRPGTYVGAVGRFDLAAQLAPTQAKVHDPMTLTLTLRGEGTLESAVAPDVAAMPEVAGRFKIYEATEETGSGSRRFTYGLRPLEAGIEAFPSVPVSYFDVESERYVTLRTDPIPIQIAEAEELADDQIVAGADGSSRTQRDLETRREGVFANVTDLSAVGDESVDPLRWLLGLIGMAGLYVAVAVVTVQIQRRSADHALLRRRGAVSKAKGRLRQGLAELDAGRAREGVDLVQASLAGLVADVADLPEAGMTPKDVCAELQTAGIEQDLVDRIGTLLETCDAARYGTSNQAEGLGHEAQQLLGEVIRALKANKRFR
jgi:hypothetical protein